ncbi:MAG: hypothetical protein HDS04_00950 [Bacteroides sp.]|nr:hypothetical protein [Bacteroides sp.]
MKHKSFFAYMAAIVMFGALGLKLYNQHPVPAPVNDITLANLEAILGSENNSESGGSDSEKGNFEYPVSHPYITECQVVIGKYLGYFNKRCGAEIITCQGGGRGCNTLDCFDHPHFNSEKN